MWSPARFSQDNSELALGAAAALTVVAGWSLARLLLSSRKQHGDVFTPASTLPLLGNTLDAMVYQRERFVDWLSEQSQLAGGRTWRMQIVGQPPMFVISTPQSYEDLMRRQLHVFERGATMSYIFKDFLGEGIIAVDGLKWQQQRKAASHLFTNRMMREIMDAQVIEKSVQFRDVLHECARRGTPVSLKSLISKFTSDVFTKIGFGVELHGLDLDRFDLETEHPFIEAIDVMCRLLQARAQSPMFLWRLKRWLNVGDEGEAKKHMKVIKDLVTELMLKSLEMKNEHIEGINSTSSTTSTTKTTTTTTTTTTVNGKTSKTTVSKTSKADDAIDADSLRVPSRKTGDLITFFLASGLTNPQQLQDMAVNFFFAGKDTTSFSLSWLFVMVNRHPHVLRKIREEIAAQLPELLSGEIDAPTMEQLGKLTYLEAAVRENLRLNTSMTTRSSNQDTTLSDGTFIPKGSVVYVCHYAEARQPATWGEDAAEYKPERWIDPETGKLRQISPFKFVTFIAGPRQCIGMRFAIMELMTVAAVLLSRFDVKTVEDPWDLTYELSVVFPVKGKLMVTVEPAAPISAAA